MRTKLQGRRSLFLWAQYLLVLIAVASIGYLVQSWPSDLPGSGGGPTATPTTLIATPSPIVITVAATQPLPTSTNTPDWVATTVEETVIAATNATSTPTEQPAAPLEPTLTATTAPSGLAQLRERVLTATRNSRIRNAYPQQTEQFVDALLAHLPEFQLPTLGVTNATVQQALRRPDVGNRLNALIQEVWADWSGIAGRQRFDLYTREPTYAEHNVSPFRQLVIRLIQGRQGTLADYQQHGLHNFLTRSEDAAVWSTNIDGVIGAVNRESFQWP